MGDSRSSSLVFCHAHSAQIPEFPCMACPQALLKKQLEAGIGIAGPVKKARRLFIRRRRGRKFAPFQPSGNETFPKRFPQTITRLSKPNLETCILCVNLPRTFSISVLSNPGKSAENKGQYALTALL
jgi:hypothetical protein